MGLYRKSEGPIVPFEHLGQHNPNAREGALLCPCNQRVKEREIAEMLITPEQIRTLQRKLYRKAKQEKTYRFYALYDKVYRADILEHAYRLVRANGGSSGIDGETFGAIEAEDRVSAILAELAEALRTKTYQASPVKRVMIPKGDGTERPLGIPTIRDRIAQMAVKLVIEPIFEADFCSCSYGFRPKKSAHDAIDDIAHTLNKGYTEVIDADLSKYFDTIPHAKLMAAVAERISDGAILHIIQMWLKAAVIEEDKDGTRRNVGGGKGNTKGTPQGGVISPLLANLYLHLMDRMWERNNLQERLEARLVRYADDFVVMCRRDTEQAMKTIRHAVTRLGLTLNEKKTLVVDTNKESFTFLGFEIRMRKSRRTGRSYANVQPSKKSLKSIRSRVTEYTQRELTAIEIDDIIKRVNTVLRGWVGYFHYRNCSSRLSKLKWHVEERVRTHLRKRHKIRDRGTGYNKFTTMALYERYCLYKVPTTAGFAFAHVLR